MNVMAYALTSLSFIDRVRYVARQMMPLIDCIPGEADALARRVADETFPLRNLWIGADIRRDTRSPQVDLAALVQIPAELRFIKIIPAQKLDFGQYVFGSTFEPVRGSDPDAPVMREAMDRKIHWIMTGGEAIESDFAYIADQCIEHGTPLLIRSLFKRSDPRTWPKRFRIQQFPECTHPHIQQMQREVDEACGVVRPIVRPDSGERLFPAQPGDRMPNVDAIVTDEGKEIPAYAAMATLGEAGIDGSEMIPEQPADDEENFKREYLIRPDYRRCPRCGSLQHRGNVKCSQCGEQMRTEQQQ
jgi:hypothetical protein